MLESATAVVLLPMFHVTCARAVAGGYRTYPASGEVRGRVRVLSVCFPLQKLLTGILFPVLLSTMPISDYIYVCPFLIILRSRGWGLH